ncbi:hypothetical protein [Hymenobacter volaticus]|uniref:Uncharacterized protein n=1 Tax=Hymenobacter volaticus TaxID=2932254 RepID=A0ABY4GGE2_9BACT|nr:hypothetical protein [Hymenobacter volaticus]UOQ69932.1 hypothetical protein MUN86_30545 [Hymenobacter volaticus]
MDKLEAAWELETGFLGCLREGIFDPVLYGDFVTLLMSIQLDKQELLPQRFVTLLWFIPLFMEWQTERVAKTIGEQEYQAKRTRIETQLERILGLP